MGSAHALLVEAAAKKWSVDKSSLRTEDGHVIYGEKRASYGELATAAAALPVPENVELKDPKDFKLIGTNVKRIEGESKVTGQAQFSMDVNLPDMLTAVVAHPPVWRQGQELQRRQSQGRSGRCESETNRIGCRRSRKGFLDGADRTRRDRDRMGRR